VSYAHLRAAKILADFGHTDSRVPMIRRHEVTGVFGMRQVASANRGSGTSFEVLKDSNSSVILRRPQKSQKLNPPLSLYYVLPEDFPP
jgi:hypothetical protein